jgi:hypothetical protein
MSVEQYHQQAMADTTKDWGVIQVGAARFYWVSYYRLRHLHDRTARPQWLIAEGFATTRETARAECVAAGNAAPGEWHPPLLKRSDGDWRTRDIYRRYHARKPKPSAATEARRHDALGSLWTYNYVPGDFGDPDIWSWEPYPITKVTKKRIFVARKYGDGQRSFDRATLERDDEVFWYNGTGSKSFYTDAAKARIEARTTEHVARTFPLLGLAHPFTHRDVLRAFRRKAHDAHPDHGGDAGTFRALLDEKIYALKMAR